MSSVFLPSVLLVLAAQGQYHPADPKVTPEIRAKVIAEIDDTFVKKGFAMDFDPTAWKRVVKERAAEIDSASTPDELSAALTIAMMDMGTSHMAVVARKSMRHVKTTGVGLIMTSDMGTNYVYRVMRHSPAEKAGIRPGDRIVEFANIFADDVHGKPAVAKIKSGNQPSRTFKLQPAEYEPEIAPSLTPLNSKTAVLEIPSFTDSYYPKEVNALMKQADKYDNLLIDLRRNGGGRPEWLMHFLSFFLAKGTFIGTFVGKDAADKYLAENGKPSQSLASLAKYCSPYYKLVVSASHLKYHGKIAILIGAGTGSASEMVTQCLREYRNAPCIGAPTAGAVLLPDAEYIPSGYLLEYPAYDYVSAQGRRLEKFSIQPDLNVEDDPKGWPGHLDPAWIKAEKFLLSR